MEDNRPLIERGKPYWKFALLPFKSRNGWRWLFYRAQDWEVNPRGTFARPLCPDCKNEIDPDCCWCGNDEKNHGSYDEHGFVPMGCTCGFVVNGPKLIELPGHEALEYLYAQIDPHDRLNPKYAEVLQQIDAVNKARSDILAAQTTIKFIVKEVHK